MGWSVAISALIIFIISYYFFSKEIFSPTVILSAVFFVSGIFLGLYQNDWNSVFHLNTFGVIVGGLLVSFILEFISRSLANDVPDYVDYFSGRIEYIYVGKTFVMITNVFAIIIFALYYREIIRMAYLGGYSGNGSIIYYSRNFMMFHYNELDSSERISSLLTQGLNVLRGVSHVNLLIFINNIICDEKERSIKSDFLLLVLPIINTIAGLVLNGGKMRIAQFVLSGLFMYFALDCIKKRRRFYATPKIIKRIIILVIALGFILRISQQLMGRSFIGGSLIEFVASYFGNPIELFNRFLQNRPNTGRMFGEETFYGFYSLLDRLRIINYDGSIQLEFLKVGNLNGNVYTGYRRLLSDFGYFGMISLHSLMILIICSIYNKFKTACYTSSSQNYLWRILVYSYIYWVIVFYPFDNSFYAFLSMREIVIVASMWVSYMLIVRKPIVIKIGEYELL